MTEKTLFIEIFQPFAQYRNPFTFYYAQSYPLPPKSTVVGMLQNAVNDYYGHELGIENWWNLKVSVHGGFESVFWNYQQLIKGYVEIDKTFRVVNQGKPLYNEGFKSQRTPVYQQELFNGHLYIFIRGNEEVLKRIKNALSKPKKVLYLGRSEDIIFIKKIIFVDGESKTAKKSLWLTYPTYIKKNSFPIKNQKYPVYSIPVFVRFLNNGVPIKNKAQLSKNTDREVKFETVIYTGFDYVVKLSEPVKYEEFYINGQSFKIFCDFGWL